MFSASRVEKYTSPVSSLGMKEADPMAIGLALVLKFQLVAQNDLLCFLMPIFILSTGNGYIIN